MSATDWPTTVAEFRERFAPYLGTRQLWFLGSRLFGLTWPRLPDGSPDPRDRSAGSLAEVATILGCGSLEVSA